MVILKKNIKLKYKPGDKIKGCDYWFSNNTFDRLMSVFIKSHHNFLLKGLPSNPDAISIVSADPVDIIGRIKEYTDTDISVELHIPNIYKGLLELIINDKLYASPVLIVSERDQYTKEILDGKIMSFELRC